MIKYIQEGLVSSVRYVALGDGKRCEVKIDTDDRVTPWIEVRSRVTKHYKEFTPPTVGDQVFIHNPNGVDNENAYVELGVAYESVSLPKEVDENKIVRWAKDGTIYIHNTKMKTITIATPCDIKVETKKELLIKAKKVIIDTDVHITGNLDVDGDISDSKGDLTGHDHKVVKHLIAKPRE